MRTSSRQLVAYVARRIGQSVLVLWLAYTLTFIGISLLPSNPINTLLNASSDGGGINPAIATQMKQYYGYDLPVIDRYFVQLWELLHGNFGYSISSGQTVLYAIGTAAPSTLVLALYAFLVAVVLTAAIVGFAHLAPWARLRDAARVLPPLFSAAPPFWVGILAVDILSFQLHIISVFPTGSFLSNLVPAIVLGIPLSAIFAQVSLKSVDTVYVKSFIDVVRAKGAGKYWVFLRHVLKNAGGPALTVAGNTIGLLLGGTVVTETVFSRTGIGTLLINAVSEQDVALVQGLVLIIAAGYVLVNLIVDLIYPLLDPRIVSVPEPARS